MSKTLFFDFNVDKTHNVITIQREFAADRATVWEAYTDHKILDQWWMPKPWKAKTKSQDFREGGKWLYAAVGPNGEEHWSVTNYEKIEPMNKFTANDAFCDSNGKINPEMPQSKWIMNFKEMGQNTLVEGIINYPDLAQLEATLKMGFKEGLTMAMENLDTMLAKR
ncbi:MAG: SRPBCC domain-containing protein [Bacteroidia bacterium]|jgi:uncharacterized protein YndB with AHSA1/START domain